MTTKEYRPTELQIITGWQRWGAALTLFFVIEACAWVLFALGIGLSFTIVLAIIGIPLMFVSVLLAGVGMVAPFVIRLAQVKCPRCENVFTTNSTQRVVTCGSCQSKLVLKDKMVSVLS